MFKNTETPVTCRCGNDTFLVDEVATFYSIVFFGLCADHEVLRCTRCYEIFPNTLPCPDAPTRMNRMAYISSLFQVKNSAR